MNPFTWLWSKLTQSVAIVHFAGRKIRLTFRRWRKPTCTPQEYADRNLIICGKCGEVMFPGEKIWLIHPITDEEAAKAGVLVVGEGERRSLVGCLSWGCPPTAGVMCGDLLEDRKIEFFESPISKAMRTSGAVIVSDVPNYRG